MHPCLYKGTATYKSKPPSRVCGGGGAELNKRGGGGYSGSCKRNIGGARGERQIRGEGKEG